MTRKLLVNAAPKWFDLDTAVERHKFGPERLLITPGGSLIVDTGTGFQLVDAQSAAEFLARFGVKAPSVDTALLSLALQVP
jgi:hypothetical protein